MSGMSQDELNMLYGDQGTQASTGDQGMSNEEFDSLFGGQSEVPAGDVGGEDYYGY
jgi:hypothetical protein